MRIWPAALLVATGCGRILGIGDFHLADASVPGDSSDAPRSGDGALCVGNGFLGTVCLTADPPASVTLGASIDTDASASCSQFLDQGAVTSVCIVAGHSITQQGTSYVTGSHPLALVALDSITIGGTLDASSGMMNGNILRTGAGADPASCPALLGADNVNGGTGGAGGGMGEPGGAGGGNSSGTPGAAPDNPFTPTKLRGGCPGGNGGNGASSNSSGTGGHGGGAIYLLAGTSITVAGAVYASGAGGMGGQPKRGGGGGGGAGGFIGLEAPTIDVTGTIAANGGGGGAGAGDTIAGGNAQDGTTSSYSMPAAGGNQTDGKASAGGRGGALQMAAQAGVNNLNCCGGAGAGGGGVGVVWVKGAFSGMKISPAPMQH